MDKIVVVGRDKTKFQIFIVDRNEMTIVQLKKCKKWCSPFSNFGFLEHLGIKFFWQLMYCYLEKFKFFGSSFTVTQRIGNCS
ncbi:hypothetical protein K7X08_011069 [Anisodus acutangulus]|uniref:Uncharacterized protein n=1 Tax=Anisodus acutangulus TaxID=402998 RepID=A0A9Q1LZA0_9SOLA|nr:hypothetical protein K7X08_011069 [Anisodus acutangulus]